MTISLSIDNTSIESFSNLPPGLEAGAAEIVDLLRRSAVSSDGGTLWNGPGTRGLSAPLDPEVHSGSAGIALFLAAWAHSERCRPTRAAALEATLPIRRGLEALGAVAGSTPETNLDLGGGMTGIGSMIYALARIALWLEDDECARIAAETAARITPQQIESQPRAGLADGVAGLTTALLVAQQAALVFNLQVDLSASILACGHYLRRLLDHTKLPVVSGFGHGYSGVAYAFTRLHDEQPDGDWHWDAHVALAQERRLFDAGLGVWLSPDGHEPVMDNSWSQGAAGMLLARTALAHRGVAAPDPASEQDFHTCLAITRDQTARRRDHLNGGNLGHALILQQAGWDLEDADLSSLALQIGRSVASRCPASLFLPNAQKTFTSWTDPSLMNGLAGIGYAFLKLRRPTLPSLLLLE